MIQQLKASFYWKNVLLFRSSTQKRFHLVSASCRQYYTFIELLLRLSSKIINKKKEKPELSSRMKLVEFAITPAKHLHCSLEYQHERFYQSIPML